MLNFLIEHWILTTLAVVYFLGFVFFKATGWGWTLSLLWPIVVAFLKLGFFSVQ